MLLRCLACLCYNVEYIYGGNSLCQEHYIAQREYDAEQDAKLKESYDRTKATIARTRKMLED